MKELVADEHKFPPVFVGNRFSHTLDMVGPDGKSLRDKYLVGDPQACQAGSAEEMKRKGLVGVYTRKTKMNFRLPGTERRIRKSW